MGIGDHISPRNTSGSLCSEHDLRGVVHVDQIQKAVLGGCDRPAGDDVFATRNSARTIDAGQPQNDRTLAELVLRQQLFGCQARAASFALGPAG